MGIKKWKAFSNPKKNQFNPRKKVIGLEFGYQPDIKN